MDDPRTEAFIIAYAKEADAFKAAEFAGLTTAEAMALVRDSTVQARVSEQRMYSADLTPIFVEMLRAGMLAGGALGAQCAAIWGRYRRDGEAIDVWAGRIPKVVRGMRPQELTDSIVAQGVDMAQISAYYRPRVQLPAPSSPEDVVDVEAVPAERAASID